MSIVALVIVAEIGTGLFFALYLGALTIGLREDRDCAACRCSTPPAGHSFWRQKPASPPAFWPSSS